MIEYSARSTPERERSTVWYLSDISGVVGKVEKEGQESWGTAPHIQTFICSDMKHKALYVYAEWIV
jgi:hypothetical protein